MYICPYLDFISVLEIDFRLGISILHNEMTSFDVSFISAASYFLMKMYILNGFFRMEILILYQIGNKFH